MLRSLLTVFTVVLVVAAFQPSYVNAEDTEQDFFSTFFPDPTVGGDPPRFRFDQWNSAPNGEVLVDGGWDGSFARIGHTVGS